ncbi:MAG: hypothetical protein KF680_06705 [Cryobacterium sp.]|nr:hypothetical protein [Cryobacterium sp.]
MSTSRTLRIVAVASAALLLVGCGRFQVELAVNENNTLDGTIVVAVLVGDEAGAEQQALSAAEGIEEQILPGLRNAPGVTHEEYDQDGYRGSRLVLLGTPLSALNESDAFTLERDGDTFVFTGALDFTPDDEDSTTDGETAPDEESTDVAVALRFPGAVTSHNGDLSGTTVNWNTEWSGSLDMRATANAVADDVSPWVWIVGVLLLLILLAAVIAAVVVGRSRAGVQQTGTVPPVAS